MWERLYTLVMWLAKLLFLLTIGYAASDIAPNGDNIVESKLSFMLLDTTANTQLLWVTAAPTMTRLASITDSMTT